MDISYQPTKQETFKYKVKVSRDNYKWYDEKYVYWAKSQELTITIGRTIDIRDNLMLGWPEKYINIKQINLQPNIIETLYGIDYDTNLRSNGKN